jgi:uncharacterized protein
MLMEISTEVLRREFINATNLSHLGLAVSLTEQCNFRCTYCYESFELGAMPEETYRALERYAQRVIPTLKTLYLSWFGGEPLLEWKRMASFTRLCKSLCDQHGVKMPSATVPTNAWGLTPEILETLTLSGVGTYMVSLDGLGRDHDLTRKLISGKGTFERVYRNIKRAAATDCEFKMILRLHLHADNIDSQLELLERLRVDFAPDERFTMQPAIVGNFGGESVKTLTLIQGEEKDLVRAMKDVFRPDQKDYSAVTGPYVCYAGRIQPVDATRYSA